MNPIRLALIGNGKWGRNYVTAARESGEAEVTHVVKRGEPIPRDVDAVVIAVHPSSAPELCERALAAGKPVMVEKPAGLCLADAERIRRAEEGSEGFVLVNHQHLFAEQYERIRAMGVPPRAIAFFTGHTKHDYSPYWDFGAHAAACLLGVGFIDPSNFVARLDKKKRAEVRVWHDGKEYLYDGYAPAEPPLTRSVRAFARAVRAGGTDDWRFGAKWAVDVARVLETASKT